MKSALLDAWHRATLALGLALDFAADAKDADIEHLLDHDFYLELVSIAYNSELPASMTAADVSSANRQITREVQLDRFRFDRATSTGPS